MTNNDNTVFRANEKQTGKESINATQKSEKNKKWKKVGIGAASAILLGGSLTGGSKILAADLPVDDAANDGDMQATDVTEAQESFQRAFSEARQSAGHSSSFRWRGATFSTHTTEEWDKMSEEEQDEIAEQASMDDAEEETMEDAQDVAAEDTQDVADEQAPESGADADAQAEDPNFLHTIIGDVVGKVTDKLTDKAGEAVDSLLGKVLGTGGSGSMDSDDDVSASDTTDDEEGSVTQDAADGNEEQTSDTGEEDMAEDDDTESGEIGIQSDGEMLDEAPEANEEPVSLAEEIDSEDDEDIADAIEVDADEGDLVEPIVDDFEGSDYVDVTPSDDDEVMSAEIISEDDGDDEVYEADVNSDSAVVDDENTANLTPEATTVEELAESIQNESAGLDEVEDTSYIGDDMTDVGITSPVNDDDMASM